MVCLADGRSSLKWPPHGKEPKHPLLVADKAKHVGDAIAIVIAESQAEAVDAAEAIVVEYEELPAIVDASKAVEDGAPQVFTTARPTTFALTGRWVTRLKKLMQPLQHQRMF